MPEERIDEAIAVAASFRGGIVTPTAFTWKNRDYPVAAVHARWIVREGHRAVRNFSVETASGDVYHIALDCASLTWRLERVFLP